MLGGAAYVHLVRVLALDLVEPVKEFSSLSVKVTCCIDLLKFLKVELASSDACCQESKANKGRPFGV